jgi:hypothetical protein
MSKKKETEETKGGIRSEPNQFLDLSPPSIPDLLENVILVFSNNIPEDAKPKCKLNTDAEYPQKGDEVAQRQHLLGFVRERLELISRLEYTFWLNGRLPFVSPRELLLWRLRQYVEHIWAFQLPDDDDLAMIFNSTKMRAAHLSSDFTARFRKALLFPVALRRIYRILRREDQHYTVVEVEFEHKQALGSTFRVPSSRYLQEANALIDEYRLREGGFLRDAAMISGEDNILWVSQRVLKLAGDDKIRAELLDLYKIPRESGFEG